MSQSIWLVLPVNLANSNNSVDIAYRLPHARTTTMNNLDTDLLITCTFLKNRFSSPFPCDPTCIWLVVDELDFSALQSPGLYKVSQPVAVYNDQQQLQYAPFRYEYIKLGLSIGVSHRPLQYEEHRRMSLPLLAPMQMFAPFDNIQSSSPLTSAFSPA